MSIYFHTEACSFTFTEKFKSKKWLKKVLKEEKKREGNINIIFTNNTLIQHLNIKYLSREYFTDVIAFDYQEENKISGDIYISIDTVKENSKRYECPFHIELKRVIVHGLLHLIGYKDKTRKEKIEIKEKETFYLMQYPL